MRAWLLLVAACGVDHRGDERIVAPETVEAEFRAATCTHLAACHVYPDRATCLATNFDASVLDSLALASVDEGRLIFDATKAEQCFAALASASCLIGKPGQQDQFAACWSEVFSAKLLAGERCDADRECVSQDCVECSGCNGSTAPVATAPIAIGGACSFADTCVDGAYCDATNQCAQILSPGASCTVDAACGALRCIELGCQPLPTLGQSCEATGACGEIGTHCSPDTELCVSDRNAGESCTGNDCQAQLFCDTSTFTCQTPPHLGQACQGPCNDYDTRCFAQICTAYLADGEACTTFLDCMSDNCTDGRCAPQLPDQVCR